MVGSDWCVACWRRYSSDFYCGGIGPVGGRVASFFSALPLGWWAVPCTHQDGICDFKIHMDEVGVTHEELMSGALVAAVGVAG